MTTPRAEKSITVPNLKQAAENYPFTLEGVYEQAGNRTYVTEHVEEAFIAGASYMQARILELLRSGYSQHLIDNDSNPSARMDADDWLEAQLLKEGE